MTQRHPKQEADIAIVARRYNRLVTLNEKIEEMNVQGIYELETLSIARRQGSDTCHFIDGFGVLLIGLIHCWWV